MMTIHSTKQGADMKAVVFALLTIAGAFAGLIVGAAEDNKFMRSDAMAEKAIAGGVCGMIAGVAAAWITGSGSKKD